MLVPHTHTHTHTHTHRLILVNSQIFNFFLMVFVSIVAKANKHEKECYIVNLILLFQLKIISYIEFIKIII